MPIYEFHCGDCKVDFEELVLNSREKISCPNCNGLKCEKLMSAAVCLSRGGDGNTTSMGGGGGCSGCMSTSSCGTCGGGH